MPEQILLQGKILGTEEFALAGRSQWISLLCEVLPRALLSELKLTRMLLGSSGGGQFLLILPGDLVPAADSFFQAAANQIRDLSRGHVNLIWSITDNLGDWAVIRK